MTGKQKKDLLKIGGSALLFALGIVLDNTPLLIAAYVLSGYETVIEAVMGIVNRQFLDENFLMTIASLGAIYCGDYRESVAVMLFYKVGEFFEHYAVNSSRKSIADLMDIKAEFATRVTKNADGSVVEEIVEPEDLVPGDVILIKPGEKVPVDGVVTDGSSALDTAALTGESLPQDIAEGDSVTSGTINLTGAILVQVSRPYEDSTVAKVLDLVENASSRKANIEGFITKFARYYTPAVVLLAVLLAVLPPIFKVGTFSEWLYRAMVFLVISCPCALVISVPLSLFAGIGSASKEGILVKGSNYLEALAKVDTFAFDKTGTLTRGQFQPLMALMEKSFSKSLQHASLSPTTLLPSLSSPMQRLWIQVVWKILWHRFLTLNWGVSRLRQRMRRSMAPKRSRCHLHSAYMVLVCIAWLNREYIVDIGKLRMVLPAVEWCQLYGETEG